MLRFFTDHKILQVFKDHKILVVFTNEKILLVFTDHKILQVCMHCNSVLYSMHCINECIVFYSFYSMHCILAHLKNKRKMVKKLKPSFRGRLNIKYVVKRATTR